MLSSLSHFQASEHEVSVALPLLQSFKDKPHFTGRTIPAISNDAPFYSDVSKILKNSCFREATLGRVTVYFFESDLFIHRSSIYGASDEHFNFAVFSAGCYFLGKALDVDLVHGHDWHVALTIVLNALDNKGKPTCFTIHNLAYQGDHPKWMTGFLRIDPFNIPEEVMLHLEKMNYLKGALLTANEITTVSPGYRNEILSEPSGQFLAWLLNQRQDSLTGILNCIDTNEWNPEFDRKIYSNYSRETSGFGKQQNKISLYHEFGIKIDPSRPLIGLIGRLTYQKGFGIFLSSFFQKRDLPFYYFFLGSGDKKLEDTLLHLSHHVSDRLCFYKGFDEALARKIEAASDFFLMPSLFEPCGLNQFYSHIYGSVPIVSRVGGLKDSVIESDLVEYFTGFIFEPGVDHSLNYALDRALSLYYDKERFMKVRKNIMAIDWSWEKSLHIYTEVYKKAVAKKKT